MLLISGEMKKKNDFLNGENVLPDIRFGCSKWNGLLRYRFYDENLHFTPQNWKSYIIFGRQISAF